VTANPYVPDIGDIVSIDFITPAEHGRAGRCQAVVLSPKAYNAKSGLMVCLPVTSKIKGYPFEVPLSGQSHPMVALADQLNSLGWESRQVERIGRAKPEELGQLLAMIKALLKIM